MEDKITFIGAMRWMRDEAGALLATFWLIFVLFAIGGWIAYSFFQIDAEFSRPLAGGVMPEEVTQHLSWAILAFSIAGGPAIIWCHMHAMPKFQKLLIILDALAAILLILHAYGIASKVMEGQYSNAAAIETINDKENTSSDATIAILQAQQAGIRTDRDARVARLQQSIDNITNDGLDNDHLADAYRADQEKAEEEAKQSIDKIDAKILKLTEDTGSKNVKATEDAAKADSFNPLFTFMARFVTWTWDPAKTPSDTAQYACGAVFFTLFFGLGKLLMMTLFTIAYAMMLVAREKARRSASAKKGHETRKANEEEAASKPPRGYKEPVGDDGYWSERIKRALKTKLKDPTADGMWNTYFPGVGSVHELRSRLNHLLKKKFYVVPTPKDDDEFPLEQWHVDFILREGDFAKEYPVAEADPQSDNDEDEPLVAAE